MFERNLSKPQKLLIGCNGLVLLVGVLVIIVLSLQHISYTNRPVSIINSNNPPVNNQGESQDFGVYFDQLIYQNSGYSHFNWNGNDVVLVSPGSISFTDDSIKILSGSAFITFKNKGFLYFGENSIEMINISGVYNANSQSLTVLSGELKISDVETASINTLLLHDGYKFTTAIFDRGKLAKETNWQEIIKVLNDLGLTPGSIADLNPPELFILDPLPGSILTDFNTSISGQSESGATVMVGEVFSKADEEGNFILNVKLNAGQNSLVISAVDSVGNITEKLIRYTVNIEEETNNTTEDLQTGICSSGNFSQDLVCLINKHRLENDLNTLTRITALDSAAENHSEWMHINLTGEDDLTHIQEDGSSFADRCKSFNTDCDAENIAYFAYPVPKSVFEYWENSASDGINMLGEHTNMGVSIVGGFITTIFN